MSNSPSQKNRAIISLFMLFGFLAIVVTGVLSYTLRYSTLLSAIHTVFGLLFVGYGIFHIRNNFRPVMNYLKLGVVRRWRFLSIALIPLTVFGVAIGLPPFQTVIDAGYALKSLRPVERTLQETLYTHFEAQGQKLSIDIKAGEYFAAPGAVVMGVQTNTTPQMAVWIEDMQGNYIDTLYVTKKASNSSYMQSLFGGEETRRPEALPVWSHARGITSKDGLMMPSKDKPIADAVTGATPLWSFDIKTVADLKQQSKQQPQQKQVVVKLELNQSFDYNDTYHKNAFPNDPIYSGTGNTAQPSLVYGATVNLSQGEPAYFMSLLGRGHHSGQHADLITDLSGITTARNLRKRAIVEVERGDSLVSLMSDGSDAHY